MHRLVTSLSILGICCAVYPMFAIVAMGANAPQLWSDSAFQQELLYRSFRAASALLASSLAIWIAMRAYTSPSNRVFALFLTMFGLAASDEGRFEFVSWALPGPTRAATWPWIAEPGYTTAEILYGLCFAACLAAAVRWAGSYPDGTVQRELARPPSTSLSRRLALFVATPAFAWVGVGGGSATVMITAGLLGDRASVQIVCATSALVISTWLLMRAYRRVTNELQSKMYWILQAAICSSLLLVISLPVEFAVHQLGSSQPVLGWLHASLLPLSLLALIAFLCVGVLYAGAVDPILVVRRTLLYSAAGLIVTFVFVGVETSVSAIVERWIALPDRIASWVAGFTAALTFGPIRAWVDRRLATSPKPGRSAQLATSPRTR